jgi:hypothetical protein
MNDRIETPRRWSMDNFNGDFCRSGDYARSITSGKVYLVLSARFVRVKVSRGETSRQALEVIPWPDDLPADARVFDFETYRRPKQRPKTLRDFDR